MGRYSSNASDYDPGQGVRVVFNDKRTEMAAFDALPAELRDLINYAPLEQSACDALRAVSEWGAPTAISFFKVAVAQHFPGWTPDRRAGSDPPPPRRRHWQRHLLFRPRP